jgi:hypothetical protein
MIELLKTAAAIAQQPERKRGRTLATDEIASAPVV